MSREENIEIFRDTEKLCKTNPVLLKAWKDSSSKQKLILENEEISAEKNIYEQPAKIVVSKKRTFEAAMAYEDKKVAVLNFASASNPGGGVVNGSSAQEECLCRCSTLYYNLTEDDMWKKFYLPHRHAANPIHNDDLIEEDIVIAKVLLIILYLYIDWWSCFPYGFERWCFIFKTTRYTTFKETSFYYIITSFSKTFTNEFF